MRETRKEPNLCYVSGIARVNAQSKTAIPAKWQKRADAPWEY